jgi:hypothetical protein
MVTTANSMMPCGPGLPRPNVRIMPFRRRFVLIVLLAVLLAPAPLASEPETALVRVARMAGLRPEALRPALRAHARASAAGLTTSPLLTVIDYALPSRVPRLWVLDLRAERVLARELVAHGRGSGGDLAHRFSNRAGSLQSSLGPFLTGRVYRGKHGTSLRLRGLDPVLNGRAEARAIVVHAADYVSEQTIAALGRLGRSQGCPALGREAARRVIGLIRDGTLLFAYHPSADTESGLATR